MSYRTDLGILPCNNKFELIKREYEKELMIIHIFINPFLNVVYPRFLRRV